MNFPAPKKLTASQVQAGQSDEFIFDITEAKIRLFSEISGDFNPLHINREYSHSVGLSGAVVHGAFQQAIVSQAVGMRVIGIRCLVKSYSSKFIKPLIYPARVKVSSTVLDWNPATSSGKVLTKIYDLSKTACFSETVTEVLFHSSPKPIEQNTHSIVAEPASVSASELGKKKRPVILIVGASSGLFRGLLTDLLRDYDLILTARRAESFNDLEDREKFPRERIKFFSHDFQFDSENDFAEKLRIKLADRSLWGILYGASLAPNDEDILNLNRTSFENSMLFGGYLPVLLAKTLAASIEGDFGGRLVLIGSNYATHNSPKRGVVTYGLAKSSLVSTAKAIAVELAKKKITINVISPDFIAVGMNSQASARLVQIEVAGNPMKRICTPLDVIGAIKYFMSPEAGFITAQELILSGGKV